MKDLQNRLSELVEQFVFEQYKVRLSKVDFVPTKKEFEGDITIVLFSMLKEVKADLSELAALIGDHLSAHSDEVERYSVVKGFLNLSLSNTYLADLFAALCAEKNFGKLESTAKTYMVEYSSPNTNKPLHLGHVRNNVLGCAVANILEAAGNKVIKTQIINDRGIHICKSMVAWLKYGEGETPQSTGLKGDHLVGKFYVIFDKVYKEQQESLKNEGLSEDMAAKQAPIFVEAQEMLRKWEAQDPETIALWSRMNQWVYSGFNETYSNLGVHFDRLYYESDTYLLGRDIIEEGLLKNVFYKKPDNSVWADLTDSGLDEKLVLRSDQTAVYMTQDLGTAVQRVVDFPEIDGMVYTVGNEQDYHFKVLFILLQRLGYPWASDLHHLSYGMVDLPSGKMKSREGTVVDADDLMVEMAETAGSIASELGKLDGFSDEEKQQLFHQIGLGALKYFILKVDPKKRILFDPEASVDFQGNTGPFIQYTYARIRSIARKVNQETITASPVTIEEKERALILSLAQYPDTIRQAAEMLSPALVANYLYELVKQFNSMYQQLPILGATDEAVKSFRVALTLKVGEVIRHASNLLGIEVPERM
ncbi:MAG: arginine--tRNA ligase [Bacteroidetes bacterium]|nr:arginine--tRNA ligase [Bacteroidota bacterium]